MKQVHQKNGRFTVDWTFKVEDAVINCLRIQIR